MPEYFAIDIWGKAYPVKLRRSFDPSLGKGVAYFEFQSCEFKVVECPNYLDIIIKELQKINQFICNVECR